MKIRTWDKVQVMSGKEKDKWQISVVVKTFPDKNKILVKDVNVVTKHIKRQGTNPGQIVEMEKLPRNTEVGFGISYKDNSHLYAYKTFSFNKE